MREKSVKMRGEERLYQSTKLRLSSPSKRNKKIFDLKNRGKKGLKIFITCKHETFVGFWTLFLIDDMTTLSLFIFTFPPVTDFFFFFFSLVFLFKKLLICNSYNFFFLKVFNCNRRFSRQGQRFPLSRVTKPPNPFSFRFFLYFLSPLFFLKSFSFLFFFSLIFP